MSVQHRHLDHPDSRTEIQRLKLSAQCKRKAKEDDGPLRQLFNDVCRQALTEAAGTISFADVENAVFNNRRYQERLASRMRSCGMHTSTTATRSIAVRWQTTATDQRCYLFYPAASLAAVRNAGVFLCDVQDCAEYILPTFHRFCAARRRHVSCFLRAHVKENSGFVQCGV